MSPIFELFSTGLKPDKVKHVACGRVHTIFTTGKFIWRAKLHHSPSAILTKSILLVKQVF